MNTPEASMLAVPRGTPGKTPLELDMRTIYEAERRLPEIALVSNATKMELAALYNNAANEVGKYLGWIEYELLKAKKVHTANRSNVIMGVAIEEAKRLKELGIKMNEDIREALISKDEACSQSQDIVDSLLSVKVWLEEKKWSFIRSFNSISEQAQGKSAQPTPNFVGTIGQTYNLPQANFMGRDERKKE
jgi:hypothetical protein